MARTDDYAWGFAEPRFVYIYSEMFEDYHEFRNQPSKVFLRLIRAKTEAVPGRRRDWVRDKHDARRWELYSDRGEIVGEIVKIQVAA